MPRTHTITYREVASPIADPVTTFGGQPVWVEQPYLAGEARLRDAEGIADEEADQAAGDALTPRGRAGISAVLRFALGVE